jgi:hypothetical protein
MKRLLRKVGQGHLHVDARLRKGDELQDFFDAFAQMVANLRTFEQKQLEDVEKALAAVDRGEKDEAKAALGRVRETMQSALQG